ncbi:MAG: flagellar M-ring protein FliF [Candidatus Marinimicrobia bacterium]|nr:flagellar M-ring protein FliF [Candidatus Neomarinimicrobiota bacterium]
MPPFFQQIRTFLEQFTIGQRIALFTVAIGVLSAMIVLSLWANRPEYTLLYRDLSPEDANEIVGTLRDDGVPYRLSSGGTAVYVPVDQVTEYRLTFAAGGLGTGAIVGFELFDEQRMGMTTFMQRVNYQRALEGELTHTISMMDEIKTCRVHLVIPEKRFFEDEKSSSASIVLHLEPTAYLRPRQIKGIAMMVANSVPELLEENVNIVDASGKLLTESIKENGEYPIGSRNWEIRRSVENELQKKAQELLDDVLGFGKSKVKVSAELNFEQLERTSEIYDTEDAAILSEEHNSESFVGTDTSSRIIEQSVTNYELNKTVEHFIASSGDIRRLTVAVLIDGRYATSTNAEGETVTAYQPRTATELNQFSALISTALGIDLTRGDQIEVQNLQFDREVELAEAASLQSIERSEFWKRTIANAAIGIGLLVALFFLLKILHRASQHISITQLLPGAAAAPESIMVGGVAGLAAIPGGMPVTAAGALEATGEMEMVTDTFMQKLSPEARAQLEAQDRMTQEVTKFTEENPEGAAQLLRIWTSGMKA